MKPFLKNLDNSYYKYFPKEVILKRDAITPTIQDKTPEFKNPMNKVDNQISYNPYMLIIQEPVVDYKILAVPDNLIPNKSNDALLDYSNSIHVINPTNFSTYPKNLKKK